MRIKPLMLLMMVVTLTGCAGDFAGKHVAPAPLPQPVPILQTHRGDAPALSYPMVRLIRDEADLQRLNVPALQKLNIELDQHDMVLLAMGREPTGGYWADIASVDKLGRTLTIHGKTNQPDSNAATTQQVTYPYCVVVIPKLDVLEVRSDIEAVVGQDLPAGTP